MRKKIPLLTLFVLIALVQISTSWAQSVTIDPSNTAISILEVKSTNKGFLMPRMTEVQRGTISGLTTGTQVYCTNCAAGIGPYTYNGSVWVQMFNTAQIMYAVGQAKQGGIIFYVDDSGQHGLVAATVDHANSVKWLNTDYKTTNAVRTSVYGGQFNTENIIESQGSGTYAAMVASEYNGGGFGDWYLPSKDELNLMYQQRASIGMGNVNLYWSSTEVWAPSNGTSEIAYIQNFNGGASSTSSKNFIFKVRPIRRF